MRLDTLRQDIAYAVRGLRRKPAFTIAVVATLALGLGANAAMFSIVDQLLFRPPPMLRDAPTAHRVYIAETNRNGERIAGVGRYVRFEDLKRWTHSFSSMAGYTARTLAIGTGENAREMAVGAVSYTFFSFFDAPPVLGRYFIAAEDTTPDGAAVTVLGYAMWQSHFGGLSPTMRSWRLGATMFVAFGALALLVAAMGLYSVIAYNVAQRSHEMGVRLALGAQPRDLANLVLSSGARVATSGVAIGVVIALWASRWLEPLLFDVSSRDKATYITASVVPLAVAMAGSWFPARRAARTDPNIALRSE